MLRYREALVLTRLSHFKQSLKVYGQLAKAGQNNQSFPDLNVSVGLAGLRKPLLPGDVPADQQEMYAAAGDATLRLLRGDPVGAQQAFEAFFQRFPDVPNAHLLYGSLIMQVEPELAIAEYKQELEVAPTNARAAAMVAWVLLAQADPSDALPYAEKAESEEPTLAVAQLVLGCSLTETGNLSTGIKHLETALQLKPHRLEEHVALASAYSNAGREEDARRERLVSIQIAKASLAGPLAHP
jgi:tetratricopeptide (TPR) repeat protein